MVIALPFKGSGQIGDASSGADHLRAVVGPAAERDCHCAGLRAAGRRPRLTRSPGKMPAPRMATRVLLRDANQQPIDDAVVLWFPGPASATGEDVAEFHVHGGRAVLASLFAALSAFDDVRAAEPGEFTRRAFENGKLDLTEAEGLDDLIHADTDRQRRQALRQLKGLLGDKARDWRARDHRSFRADRSRHRFLRRRRCAARADRAGAGEDQNAARRNRGSACGTGRSERLREGLVVAIAGPPNVGKSTLMNQLARREVAIVSPHAGTTRDIIEVQLDLDGYPVTVIDTAGIRETDDPVEQEGVRRARARAAEADLVLWLVDAQQREDLQRRRGAGMDGAQQDRSRSRRPLAGRKARTRADFGISASRGDGIGGIDRRPGRVCAGLFWLGRGWPDRTRSGSGNCCSRRRIRCSAASP